MTELPALRYLVRCRVVKFQDWSVTRHTSDDDDGHGRADDDDEGDSGDSNHNRHHPGLDCGGRRSSWGPKSVRLAAAGGMIMRLRWAMGEGPPSGRGGLFSSVRSQARSLSRTRLAARRRRTVSRVRLAARRRYNGSGPVRSLDPSSQQKAIRRSRAPLTPRSVYIAR